MPDTSRRKFAILLASPALVSAQTPSASEDLVALARNQIKANSDRLREFKIDIAVEPAFAFKAL